MTPARVYLTFDDGPDPEWTPRILDLLARAGAKATFFLVGEAAARQPALARRLLAEGHEVGNHSFSHRHPWTLPERAARREVSEGAEAIADVVGRAPRFFRPPHGRLRRCMIEEARARGEALVLWSRSAVDWGPWARAAGIARRLTGVAAGDIVLMHDGRSRWNRPWETAAALPGFLQRLRARGLDPAALAL
jgi:peptidoglycan/xylan/chitin deacetylase (PgdA/CDA1 family)